MKRFGMTLVVVLALTTNLLAVGKQPTAERENWNLTINVNQLSKYLQLTGDQKTEVADICAYFKEQMVRASRNNKHQMLRTAVYGNLKLMKQVLNEKQYTEYVRLLNTTFRNRGITVE